MIGASPYIVGGHLVYGANYGYRFGLNYRMVQHLKAKVERILNSVELQPGDLVVDIGSNDGTTLGFFPESLTLICGELKKCSDQALGLI